MPIPDDAHPEEIDRVERILEIVKPNEEDYEADILFDPTTDESEEDRD